jgi:hypothetical protein
VNFIDRELLQALQTELAGGAGPSPGDAAATPAPTTAEPRRCEATRFRRARRLTDRERKSLGLQAHVGADDRDLARARFYRAFDQAIARELRQAELRPLARIGFDGQPRRRAETAHPDSYTAHPDRMVAVKRPLGWHVEPLRQVTVTRNTLSSPLDYLFFQARTPLLRWEWLTGKRFEYDFHVVHRTGRLTSNLEALFSAKVEEPAPGALQTFRPRRPRRQRLGPAHVSDARLDALARLERLAAAIGPIAFCVLERVIGRERWIKDVARELDVTAEYVSQRFREALWQAADHYAMRGQRCPQRSHSRP